MQLLTRLLSIYLLGLSLNAFSQFRYISPEVGVSISSRDLIENYPLYVSGYSVLNTAPVAGICTALKLTPSVDSKFGLYYNTHKIT